MKRSWEVSRRACLRGAGTALALPTLEAMLPGMKRARADAAPKRMVFFVFNNGTPDHANGRPGTFWPKTAGSDFEITPILQPIADLKKDILLISGLDNKPGDNVSHSATATLLSGAGIELTGPLGSPVKLMDPAAMSVDQYAANAFKQTVPHLKAFPSLFLAHPYHHDYGLNSVVWRGARALVPPMMQPSEALNHVFGDPSLDPKTLARRRAYNKSVLHYARTEADRLQKRLGRADKETLDRYLTSITELEEAIEASTTQPACAVPATRPTDTIPGMLPDNNPDEPFNPDYLTVYNFNLPSHISKMNEIVRLAFQCDLTRVVTIQLNNHHLLFDWLGSPHDKFKGSYHIDATHLGGASYPDREGSLNLYTAGCAAQVNMFGELVRKLKSTPEGDGSGSLLDNTLLVCISEMSYGDGHDPGNVPVILAGGVGGIEMGRYIAGPRAPVANLWVSMLKAVGLDVPKYGNSTGSVNLA